jgi:hypothetical protein
MTAITPKTRSRIENAVRRIERMPVGGWRQQGGNREMGAGHPRLLIAAEDIEHGQQGTAKIATGPLGSLTAGTEEFEIWNMRQKIWNGSLLLACWPTWDGEDETGIELWHCFHSWSATRIRGVATADIQPGATGTINTLVAMDGTYAPATGNASVFLPTTHVVVKSGLACWAELVFNGTASRWEVYSADCDGEA